MARQTVSTIVVTVIRWTAFTIGLALMAFAIGRSAYYPFWAARASHDQLARSWGGPSAVGATAVHWLVALPIIAAGIVLIVRCRPRRRS